MNNVAPTDSARLCSMHSASTVHHNRTAREKKDYAMSQEGAAIAQNVQHGLMAIHYRPIIVHRGVSRNFQEGGRNLKLRPLKLFFLYQLMQGFAFQPVRFATFHHLIL